MYTKRESELIQQFLQKKGCMPRYNDELDDLFSCVHEDTVVFESPHAFYTLISIGIPVMS